MKRGILIVGLLAAFGSVAGAETLKGLPKGMGLPSKAIKVAVLKKALKINETASIVGANLIYGAGLSARHVVLVRVSDDTEPSDYLVNVKRTNKQGSVLKRGGKVTRTEMLDSGSLPEIPGLP